VQYILENLRLTNLHALLAKGQEANIIRACLLRPANRKEVNPMDNESEAEIALSFATRDIARMQSSALGLPVEAFDANEIYENYMRQARRSRGSKQAAEQARNAKGATNGTSD
jgi:hypothetical protein